ncbi:MAG: hypothetical protein RTU09_06100 [Candidatus Thorarchaeota archaeon]
MSGRKVLHAVIFMVAVMILAPSAVVRTSAVDPQQREPAGLQDTLRPTVEVWNISSSANEGEPFMAWADVIDLVSGVRNVSLIIQDSALNRTEVKLLHNGSYYVASIDRLQNNRSHDLWILAFDMANNSATTYHLTVNLIESTYTPIDPSVTMPIVVSSSLALTAIVICMAAVYDKRRASSEQVAPTVSAPSEG